MLPRETKSGYVVRRREILRIYATSRDKEGWVICRETNRDGCYVFRTRGMGDTLLDK